MKNEIKGNNYLDYFILYLRVEKEKSGQKKKKGDRSRGRTEKKRLITAEASEEVIHVFFHPFLYYFKMHLANDLTFDRKV
jgi:hypothetical protein